MNKLTVGVELNTQQSDSIRANLFVELALLPNSHLFLSVSIFCHLMRTIVDLFIKHELIYTF